MINVCGLPAIAVPVLTTARGHSMGIQLVGKPGSEALLLAVATQLENVR
jgi:amidase